MHKELVYIKGFAKGRNLDRTVKAIAYASQLHEGQKRKSGEDYIEHPMRVCKQLISLGVNDDCILASALLHDVIEDCGVSELELKEKFSVNVGNCVSILSKQIRPKGVTKEEHNSRYYAKIVESGNIKAMLVKISDRCHNLSTMAGPFSKEKIMEYIKETETYIYPLCRYVIDNYPEYSDIVYSMRYHMDSIIYALNVCIERINTLENEIDNLNTQSEK